ncbi:C40 family peptidase [Streptomyces sp. NPDC003362]
MKKAAGVIALILATGMVGAAGLGLVVLADADASATVVPGGGQGLKGVPEEFRPWFIKASRECTDMGHPELTPALLAAQANQESGFSTDRDLVSPAGAQGPAQFMPGTWATWGRDADGNGVADPYDVGDAVMAQGRYMCSLIKDAKNSNIPGDVRELALAGYNAGWGRVLQFNGVPPKSFAGGQTYDYVRIIMTSIPNFEAADGGIEVSGTGTGPDALRKALGELGTPYAWGGGGPAGPTTGFCDGTNGYSNGHCSASVTVGYDCSSLVQYAYWPALKLPRTAAAQYGATSDRPVARDDLQPGDLLFWSHGDGFIYHVAMYAGDGQVLHAPRTGKTVEVVPLTNAMPTADYHGATRP